jgi:hypothetical protein
MGRALHRGHGQVAAVGTESEVSGVHPVVELVEQLLAADVPQFRHAVEIARREEAATRMEGEPTQRILPVAEGADQFLLGGVA